MDKQIGINWGLYLSSFTGTFMYFLEFMPNYIYDIGIPYFLDVKLWHVNLAPPSQTQLSKLWNSPGSPRSSLRAAASSTPRWRYDDPFVEGEFGCHWSQPSLDLVGGLEHVLFFHTLGIMIPIVPWCIQLAKFCLDRLAGSPESWNHGFNFWENIPEWSNISG